MAVEFPVPRAQLPRVEVTPQERESRKLQMERALLAALDDYDRFRTVEQGRIDVARWKLADSRDMLRLFREREAGEHAKALSNSELSFSASDDSSVSQSSHDRWDDETDSGLDRRKALFLVGDLPGQIENAVYAYITRIMREVSLVQTFLHDDIADCAMLSELEGPTRETPLHSLTYKWVVKKIPGKTDRFRDVVYVEYCGLTTTKAGDRIGYVLLESVDLPCFPKLNHPHCVRATQSVSILLRQATESVIEVFATGLADPSSSAKGRPIATHLAAQTMLTLTKAMELAECMRLTKLLARSRPARDQLIKSRKRRPSACTLCHTKSKFYNDVSLMDCIVCGHAVCTQCYTVKRVFIADGILGRFYRVDCCDTCLLLVDRSRAASTQTPIKNNVSAQLLRLKSSRNFDAMESYSFSRPRSSSDSSGGDPTEIMGHRGFGTTVEEGEEPPEPSRWARGGAPAVGPVSRQQARTIGHGTTPIRRNPPSTPLATTTKRPVDAPTPQRQPGSAAAVRKLSTQSNEPPEPIRPLPAQAVFTSSSTAITYDLRGHADGAFSATPPTSQAARPAAPTGGTVSGASQQDLLARMMELQRLAEFTYQTTKENERLMQQHRVPSQAPARPEARFY